MWPIICGTQVSRGFKVHDWPKRAFARTHVSAKRFAFLANVNACDGFGKILPAWDIDQTIDNQMIHIRIFTE